MSSVFVQRSVSAFVARAAMRRVKPDTVTANYIQ